MLRGLKLWWQLKCDTWLVFIALRRERMERLESHTGALWAMAATVLLLWLIILAAMVATRVVPLPLLVHSEPAAPVYAAEPLLEPTLLSEPEPISERAAAPELSPAPTAALEPAPTPITVGSSITFYACPPFCGAMANGETVYEGAAACGSFLERGQAFAIEDDPTGREYVCKDTGYLGFAHVDVFFEDAGPIDGNVEGTGWWWQKQVGTYAVVELR